MSIAGGLEQALLKGHALGCSTVQLFTKNASQWKERLLKKDEIATFRKIRRETGIDPVISHGGYLVNLASADPVIYRKSIEASLHELERCALLGIDYLVVHPGAHRTLGEQQGIERVIEAINLLGNQMRGCRVKILLETTAGQGTYLGSRLEEILQLIDGIEDQESIGFCLDTCHVFAAGYNLSTAKRCESFFKQVEKIVGFNRLKLIHLNDSLKKCGSKQDRHVHIGQGEIGKTAFRWIMRNPFLKDIPKIIETPKENDMDRVNLGLLRAYAANPA